MTRKRRRLYVLLLALLGLGTTAALVLTALKDDLVFFYAPADLASKSLPPEKRFRLGGLVEPGSVVREGATIRFKVTDGAATVPVTFTGVVPDLFREGQGVIAEGRLARDGQFTAREILAKHDENYMPPEVAEALKRNGQFKPVAGSKP